MYFLFLTTIKTILMYSIMIIIDYFLVKNVLYENQY